MKHIVFKQTKLSIWYPTIDGIDVFWKLSHMHGASFTGEHSQYPVFEDGAGAIAWAEERGYTASLEGEANGSSSQ